MRAIFRRQKFAAAEAVRAALLESAEIEEFETAMLDYISVNRRPFPALTEALDVARYLGWRRIAVGRRWTRDEIRGMMQRKKKGGG